MKISIITATYNSAATIAQCIRSVNDQSYKFIEHIIVDGDSKDKTLKIVNSIPNRISKIISESDNGIYDALNKGIKIASGDVIGFLHSDDVFDDNYVLEKIAGIFLEKNPDSIYSDLVYVYKDNLQRRSPILESRRI